MEASKAHDPFLALRFRDFCLLLTANVTNNLGAQMLSLAIGWELYNRTNSAMALGLVGLVQLIPLLVLVPIAGPTADRHDRRTILMLTQSVMAISALGLVALSWWQGPLVGYYLCLLLRGIGGSFARPASAALQAEVIPEAIFENSASWTTGAGQIAAIAGLALGGMGIAAFGGTELIYAVSMLANLAFITILLFLRPGQNPQRRRVRRSEQPTLQAFGESIEFLRRSPVILSAITLDLFAVLFGGATALFPIFARDILQVGPEGLGWMQAAMPIGALAATVWLVRRPPMQRAGPTFLLCVAGYGVGTIVFGLSRNFWLSLAMLFTLGGLDGVSMVVRQTLMLTRVPDHYRGRLTAIESVFINTSNQLGGFESGATAQLFGPIISVVGGGIGTILVVLGIAVFWPDLRRLRTTREQVPDSDLVPTNASKA